MFVFFLSTYDFIDRVDNNPKKKSINIYTNYKRQIIFLIDFSNKHIIYPGAYDIFLLSSKNSYWHCFVSWFLPFFFFVFYLVSLRFFLIPRYSFAMTACRQPSFVLLLSRSLIIIVLLLFFLHSLLRIASLRTNISFIVLEI